MAATAPKRWQKPTGEARANGALVTKGGQNPEAGTALEVRGGLGGRSEAGLGPRGRSGAWGLSLCV